MGKRKKKKNVQEHKSIQIKNSGIQKNQLHNEKNKKDGIKKKGGPLGLLVQNGLEEANSNQTISANSKKSRRNRNKQGINEILQKEETEVAAKETTNETPYDIIEVTKKEKEKESIKDESIFAGTFKQLQPFICESLLKNLEKNNFIRTTRIQKKSIPFMFQENDVFIKCMTGSGKTLCYVVPAVQKLLNIKEEMRIRREQGTFILVLSPTRELALQISSLFSTLTNSYPYMVVSCITGGEKKKSEKTRIRKGITILICTPGRLLDHLVHTKALKLTYLQMFILDEADKIIFLGTEDKIRQIHDLILKMKTEEIGIIKKDESLDPISKKYACMEKFQSVFISATLSHATQGLANYCLTNRTAWIEIGKNPRNGINSQINDHVNPSEEPEPKYEVPKQLKQHCVVTNLKEKFFCLVSMLLDCIEKKRKPVVFFSNHNSVEFFQMLLANLYWPTDIKKENMEVVRKKIEQESRVLEKEDEMLLRKHLKQKMLEENGILEHKNRIDKMQYKNISLEECDEEEGMLYNIKSDKHKRIYLFKGIELYILHGHLSKEDRIGNFKDFSESTNAILLCTDIVSRGINFDSLSVVIQYDPPQNFEEYIHKVGRTARLNKEGFSYLLLLKSEKEFIDLIKNQKIEIKNITANELLMHFKFHQVPSFLNAVGKEILQFLENHFANLVKDDKQLLDKATQAYLSAVASYHSISKDLRSIFNVKNLHLGHLANNFLLDQTPKEIAQYQKKESYLKIKRQTNLTKREKRMFSSIQGKPNQVFKKRNV